ncbi:MAG: YjbQ family protein [Spirochaetes bacterium]|nr:MAG: YjbQ family protein [Spirochaetota bacterium]
MIEEFRVKSTKREELINLDSLIMDFLNKSGVKESILTLFVPHTTAGITINENADPTVVRDIIYKLGDLIPYRDNYQHYEGNSDAHIKASIVGHSLSLIISNGRPLLGTWQSVYFCEFDGPRTRRVIMRIA